MKTLWGTFLMPMAREIHVAPCQIKKADLSAKHKLSEDCPCKPEWHEDGFWKHHPLEGESE